MIFGFQKKIKAKMSYTGSYLNFLFCKLTRFLWAWEWTPLTWAYQKFSMMNHVNLKSVLLFLVSRLLCRIYYVTGKSLYFSNKRLFTRLLLFVSQVQYSFFFFFHVTFFFVKEPFRISFWIFFLTTFPVLLLSIVIFYSFLTNWSCLSVVFSISSSLLNQIIPT